MLTAFAHGGFQAAARAGDPTGWDLFFQRFQAVGPTVAALIVVVGALITLRQKNVTDARTLWWTRVQWAADKAAASDADERAVGQAALVSLARDGNKDEGDTLLLESIANAQLSEVSSQDPDDDSVFVTQEE